MNASLRKKVVAQFKLEKSIWRTALAVGCTGYEVIAGLETSGVDIRQGPLSSDEFDHIVSIYATNGDLWKTARAVGRPYHLVAYVLSRTGRVATGQKKKSWKIPRGVGLDKPGMKRLATELVNFNGNFLKFCTSRGLDPDVVNAAFWKYEPEAWTSYRDTSGKFQSYVCTYCGAEYLRSRKNKTTCSSKCDRTAATDLEYFGGSRRKTVGLLEGVCQLCRKHKESKLASHHVLGKENDPDNDVLTALCNGCHELITELARRSFLSDPSCWEDLINLSMVRKLADKHPPTNPPLAFFSTVKFYAPAAPWVEDFEPAMVALAGGGDAS